MEQMRMDFDAANAAALLESNNSKKTLEPKILSVSDVNKAVKTTLETSYKQLWVKGEISNFKPHSSGHFYFNLKDSKACISAVMFRGFNQGLRFKPHDGLEVIVKGKVTVYEPRGSYQIFCEMMEPVGAGALQLAFEQLKKKLQLEGLFDSARKRPLPVLPRHVAVVTSPTGAAIRDILNVLNRRFKGLRVTVIPAVVQGDAAPMSVVNGILLAQKLTDVDVMIVGRGGGSIEDMWGFNDERVARAIAASRIPIISAVGHEIDFTIADFVADLRAPTPSAAAELVCKNAAELQNTIATQHNRLLRALANKLRHDRQLVIGFAKRLVDPKRRLQDLALRCDELSQRLESGILRRIERERQQVKLLAVRESTWQRILESYRARLARAMALLDAVSPLKVLERGYAIAYKDGAVVKSAAQLNTGDAVELRLSQGKAAARIESVTKE